MNSRSEIPADDFLDLALAALSAGDAASLRQLEAAASDVAAPLSRAAYLRKRDIFKVLVDQTGRNLRFLRRVFEKQLASLYAPPRHSPQSETGPEAGKDLSQWRP